jgi:hypothetical protein
MKSLLKSAKLLLILSLLTFTFAQNTENEKQTGSTWNFNGNIFSLSFHPVFCDSNQVLSSFRLIRDGSNMYFRYFCISGLGVLDEQFTQYTEWNGTAGNKEESLNFLDRHDLMCPEDSAMNGFQMERSGDRIRFRYNCNRVKFISQSSYTTNFVRSGTGEVHGFSVHDVKAPDTRFKTQAIKGFRMDVRYSNRWCTFTCSNFQDIRFTINFFVLRNISADNMDSN